MARKQAVAQTILQRMDAECFKRPLVDSEKGICRYWDKHDEDKSVYGRLKAKEAAE